jgi:hypothetical protein
MNLSTHNQALLRGIVAGAVVLSGLTACSRSDRSDAGRDTTQSGAATVSPTDTGTSAQPSAAAATQPAGDTANRSNSDAAAATAHTAAPSRQNTVRTDAAEDTSGGTGEAVSGYRAMEQDSLASTDTASAEMAGAAQATDSAGAAADQALTADTVAAGFSEMARDTSSAAGLGDTATVAVTDTSVSTESDTTGNIQVQADTTTIEQAQADTSSGINNDTVAVASADSAATDNSRAVAAAAAGATAAGAAAVSRGNADVSRDNAGRVRPPEDSTEVLGNVTTDSGAVANGDVGNQSESERIRPPEDSTEIQGNVTSDKDRAAVAPREARTDAVGAAPMGHTVTGPQAAALMSWAGERCVVLSDESTEVSWDIAVSPANLNPCGPGTMTLSSVRTGEKQ